MFSIHRTPSKSSIYSIPPPTPKRQSQRQHERQRQRDRTPSPSPSLSYPPSLCASPTLTTPTCSPALGPSTPHLPQGPWEAEADHGSTGVGSSRPASPVFLPSPYAANDDFARDDDGEARSRPDSGSRLHYARRDDHPCDDEARSGSDSRPTLIKPTSSAALLQLQLDQPPLLRPAAAPQWQSVINAFGKRERSRASSVSDQDQDQLWMTSRNARDPTLIRGHARRRSLPAPASAPAPVPSPTPPRVGLGIEFEIPGQGGPIVPAFYPNAIMPIGVSLDRPIPAELQPQYKTTLLAHVATPAPSGGVGMGMVEQVRREEWYPCTGHQWQSIMIKAPSSSAGMAPISHDGLFSIRWSLRIDLCILWPTPSLSAYTTGIQGEKEHMVVGSCTRQLSMLPSTPPTPPIAYPAVCFTPAPASTHTRGWTEEHDARQGTMRIKLDTSSYSPNSVVPLQIKFRLPRAPARQQDDRPERRGDGEERIHLCAELVRNQRAGDIVTREIVSTTTDLVTVDRPRPRPRTLHNGTTAHTGSQLDTDADRGTLEFEVNHLMYVRLAHVWTHGFSLRTTATLSSGVPVSLSNTFHLELTASHLLGRSVLGRARQQTPIIIGSVAEPRDALYRIPLDPCHVQGVPRPEYSNEKGWKVAPPPYEHAITQPIYRIGDDWSRHFSRRPQ